MPVLCACRLGDVVTGLRCRSGIGARLAVMVATLPVWHNDEYGHLGLPAVGSCLVGTPLTRRIFLGIQSGNTHLDYPLLVLSLIAWSDVPGGEDRSTARRGFISSSSLPPC